MTVFNLLELVRIAKSRKSAQISVMHHLIKEGVSGSQALRQMQALTLKDYPTGVGMRRTDFFRFWTPMKQMYEQVGKGSRVRADQFPGTGTGTKTPFQQVRKFNYYVTIETTDRWGDKLADRTITIVDDWKLTRGEIEEAARDMLDPDCEALPTGGTVDVTFSNWTWRTGP